MTISFSLLAATASVGVCGLVGFFVVFFANGKKTTPVMVCFFVALTILIIPTYSVIQNIEKLYNESKIAAEEQRVKQEEIDTKLSKMKRRQVKEKVERKRQRRVKEHLVNKQRNLAILKTVYEIYPQWTPIRNILKTDKIQIPAKMASVKKYLSSVEWMNNKMPKITLNQLWLIVQDFGCDNRRQKQRVCDEYRVNFETLFSEYLDITASDPLSEFEKKQEELENLE